MYFCILNHPIEIITQLNVIEKLRENIPVSPKKDAPHPKLPHSPLYKPLMDTSIMPAGFIVDLITITSNNGWEEFKTVFSPLITCLGKIHHALKK